MTSSLCHVSSFFCMLWAPRVTVTDLYEGEGQGETLMVGRLLRYAHSEKGYAVSPRVSDLFPPPYFELLMYVRGSGFIQGRVFSGTEIISRVFQTPGSEWAVKDPGHRVGLPNQGALMRATSLRAEVFEERGEWWDLRWTLFSVSHGKDGFRSPGTKGQFLKRAWRKW